jgi:hypothetical protein
MRLLFMFCCIFGPLSLMSQLFSEGISDYTGTIGTDSIRMSLVSGAGSDQLIGTYFHTSDLKDIPLKGFFRQRQIVLNEYGSEGELRGTFRLTMPELDPQGRLSGMLEGEVLTGEWTVNPGDKPVFVHLDLDDVVSGGKQLTDRYASTGAASAGELEANARLFYFAVLQGNQTAAAKFVHYPIRIFVLEKPKTIRGEAEFIRDYRRIFTAKYVQCIRAGTPHNMFVRNGEAMLGRGEVWFDGTGHVTTLNACASR